VIRRRGARLAVDLAGVTFMDSRIPEDANNTVFQQVRRGGLVVRSHYQLPG
jgi:hypothetical protein